MFGLDKDSKERRLNKRKFDLLRKSGKFVIVGEVLSVQRTNDAIGRLTTGNGWDLNDYVVIDFRCGGLTYRTITKGVELAMRRVIPRKHQKYIFHAGGPIQDRGTYKFFRMGCISPVS